MLHHFKSFIHHHQLFLPDQKILLAVSGGIDSVSMFHLFLEAGFRFGVAHCNFNLRDEESDGDEKFVKELSQRHHITFHVIHFNTLEYAELNGISTQMAARELRYNWFENIRKQSHYDAIAIAHNQDDSIETFFINLIRGTGIKGLTGIKCSAGNIIRPLLFASRKDIIAYCSSGNIQYREDSSNKTTKYLRNKIRHTILPLFEELNPVFRHTMSENMEHLAGNAFIFEENIAQLKKELVIPTEYGFVIDIHKLKIQKNVPVILFEFLSDFNFSSKMILDISRSLDAESGKQFFSDTHTLVKDRSQLIVAKTDLQLSERYYIEEDVTEIIQPIHLTLAKISNEDYNLPVDKNIASVDYDQLIFPLILRKWLEGDYFMPLGMNHMKKISDFFIDNKFSLVDKKNTWILISGNKIIWIAGHRIDDRFKITNLTKQICVISLMTPCSCK